MWGTMVLKQNLGQFSFTEPPCIWRKLCLKVWTALSASPLLEGWYGAVQICLMPFLARKDLNVELVKDGPLSSVVAHVWQLNL